jgi:hypothetical protein
MIPHGSPALFFGSGVALKRRYPMSDSEHATDKRVKTIVGAVLLLWLVLAFILGASEAYVRAPGALPLPILVGVLTPILVFLVAFWTIGSFREFVMSIDLPLAAAIQAWRLGGLGFIALYAYGVLPGLFAWPAGLGDMAIGATAPFVALALRRQPAFAAGTLFRVWNLLGILDLVVAVSLGGLSSALGYGISDVVTTFPMAKLPLVLVPTFFVPLFIMLHIASLLQAGRLKEAGRVCAWTEPTIQCGPVGTMKGV